MNIFCRSFLASCSGLALTCLLYSTAGAQESKSQHRTKFANAIKAAEARLSKSIQEAQTRYLADIQRAQTTLESQLQAPVASAKSATPYEKIVSVVGAKPGPVKQGEGKTGWFDIPAHMQTAIIFTPLKDQPKDGVVQFVVNQNTKIGLAASWAYDGNSGGGWHAERKSKSDLEKMGWVAQGEMFLNLYDRHTLFVRDCEKGERIQIRTRKYYRPFVFIPDALAIDPVVAAEPANRNLVIEVAASQKQDALELLGKDEVPEFLQGTDSFSSPLTGVALVKAHRMCKVYVAASWAYDGNNAGQWTEERWTEATFEEKGWEEVGSVKINHRGTSQEHKLFAKVFNEGEKTRIRTRKYGAPYVFALKPN